MMRKSVAVMLLSCLCLVAGNSVAQQKPQTKANSAKKQEAKKTNKKSVASKAAKPNRKKVEKPRKAVNKKTVARKKSARKTVRVTQRTNQKRNRAIENYRPSHIKYVIFDYRTGKVLEEKNANQVWPLASLTKLMTAHVFLNNHKDIGNCTAKITHEDRDTLKFTTTRLKRNTNYECGELLEAMLTVSDNYAASALARSIPGWSKSDFIKEMNLQAKRWGLSSTFFVDSSGLSPKNVSSANDYYKLTRYVAHTPFLSDLSTIKSKTVETVHGDRTQINNTNPLIRNGWKSIVSKTGYIRESGYNLAYVSDKCEAPIGLIEFGANTSSERVSFARRKLAKYDC